ncbi:hypothetical protein [Nesterenkonia suensis]
MFVPTATGIEGSLINTKSYKKQVYGIKSLYTSIILVLLLCARRPSCSPVSAGAVRGIPDPYCHPDCLEVGEWEGLEAFVSAWAGTEAPAATVLCHGGEDALRHAVPELLGQTRQDPRASVLGAYAEVDAGDQHALIVVAGTWSDAQRRY